MNHPAVKIESLHLKVPGLNRPAARQLGQEVAQQLGAQLWTLGGHGTYGSLQVRVQVPAAMPRPQLAATIARTIARRLL